MKNGISDLRQRIKAHIPHLTASQKLVANYIIEKPEKFALSSIRELEEELHTSKSTIVRLAQRIGYTGFHQLKADFLQNARKDLDPINQFKILLSDPTEKNNHLHLIADEAVKNINTTLQLIDEMQFQEAIKLLKSANHVYTAGVNISSYLAGIASYLLNRVSIQTTAMHHRSLAFDEQVIHLSKNDVVFAFSFLPYSPETIQAARYAHERNIRVISVGDKPTSEIVPYSDVFFQVAVKSMTISNSIMSALVLVYALMSQISYDLKHKTMETIESIEQIRKQRLKKRQK